ncbi:MAG: phosphate ABC transporter permease PstC, partial [Gemmatimonadales bacterium]
MAHPAPAPSGLEQRHHGDRIFRWALTLAALTIPVLLCFLVAELWHGALPAIRQFGMSFLTRSIWDP